MMKLKLTQDKYAIIDDDMAELVTSWKWCYDKTNGYACKTIFINKKHKKIYLHRFILEPADGADVDHINGNKLDNRVSNLRECTRSQNNVSRPKLSTNTIGYKGVKKVQGDRNKPYIARITRQGKTYYSKYFATPKEAAIEYNKMALEYFGEFAWLNKI